MERYREKIYAGWLGKTIGVRHGANTEGWSYQSLLEKFGEITYYPYSFKNFCSDDDLNGPAFFMRSLEDFGFHDQINSEQMGETLLNYAIEGKGFFWWGGYGISTEHTAYQNLRSGIKAPHSGSIAQNGTTIAEQIGGQIFSDCWGFLFPAEPEKAADYAARMSRVTHDGDGICGGMFIAACIAAAFECNNVNQLIDIGLSMIPEDSGYAKIVKIVREYHAEHPENWRDCFLYIRENHGYDRYPGACHIIPNAAVVILSMLYGEGDFSKSINICNMCGWDTDCNVGNLGAILGVMVGLEGIEWRWREPIKDFLCMSSSVGSLNIWDLPRLADYTWYISRRMHGEVVEKDRDIRIHFDYPGSVSAFRTDGNVRICNTDICSYNGERALQISIDSKNAGQESAVYYQTYYTNEDFDDSRYEPYFSPLFYGGQNISCALKKSCADQTIQVRLYAKTQSGQIYAGEPVILTSDWQKLCYIVPALSDETVHECGILICSRDTANTATIYLDDFHLSGDPEYRISFSKEKTIIWNWAHRSLNQLTPCRGHWTLENSRLNCVADKHGAVISTGDYHFSDCAVTAMIEIATGYEDSCFGVDLGVGGTNRRYSGMISDKSIKILKHHFGSIEVLAEAEFNAVHNRRYQLRFSQNGSNLELQVDNQTIITCHDSNPFDCGAIGFSNCGGGHFYVHEFSVSKG